MLGYNASELLNMDREDLIDAQSPESLLLLEERKKVGHARGVLTFYRKDGSSVICEVSSVVFTSNGQEMASTTLKDITVLKKAQNDLEMSYEWLSFAQKAAKSGFWDWNMCTGDLTWSDELYELFGIPLSETPSFDIWLERMHPEDSESAMNNINHSIEQHNSLENEYRIIKSDGKEIWVRSVGETYYNPENNPYRMSGLCMDITSLKESELIRKESEERYHSLFDNMLNGFAYCKMIFNKGKAEDFVYIDVNDSFKKLTGLKNVTGKKVSEVIPGIKEKDPSLFEMCGTVALTGNPESFEMFLESLNEWFSVSVYSPRKGYFVAVFDVITDRKNAEQKQELLSQQLQLALDASQMGWWHYDPKTDISTYDEQYKEIFGVTGNQMPNEKILKILHPEDVGNVWTQVEKALDPANPLPYSAEYRILNNNVVKWIEAHGITTFEGEGDEKHATSMVGTVRDVTERKNAQKNLQESKKLSENIINSMKDGFCSLSAEGIHLNVNPALCEMVGYSREELIGTKIPHIYWPEEEQENIEKAFRNIVNGNLDEKELIFKRKNGERFPVIVSPSIIRDDDGEIITVFGTFKDITKRKNLEIKLKKSEERFKTMADFTYDWEYWIGPDNNYVYVSPSCERISGYSAAEFMADNKLLKKIAHPEDREILLNHISERSAREGIAEIEFRIISKQGEEKWISHRCKPIYNENNKFLGVRATNRDITHHKMTEEVALRWEGIFENANFGLALVDTTTNRFIEVNQTYAQQRGYIPEELIGEKVINVHPLESREKIRKMFPKIDETGHAIFEATNITKEGVEFPVLTEVTVLKDKNGHPKSRVAYVLDISELKEMESDLKTSKEKFHELFDNAQDMITLNEIKDNGLPGRFIEVNSIGTTRLGYSREEFLNMEPIDIVTPEDRKLMPEIAAELNKNGHAQYEIRHATRAGKIVPVEINNHIFELDGKKVALAIIRDITDRLKSNKALEESESRYRGLFNKSSSYLILISAEGILIDVNEAAANFTGKTKEELIGHHFSELGIMPEEELPDHLNRFTKAIKGEKIRPYESKAIDKYGTTHYVVNSLNPLKKKGKVYAFHVICNDITDLKLAENEITTSLHEKEVLLQEIHHRVKNNMQIISSILNLQSYSATEEETKNILKDSQGRIRAMSMVHEKLYRSPDLSHINFKSYVEKLVYDLLYSYKTPNDFVTANINIEKNIELNIETTIPLGLIINELVTNSLKFAFTQGKGLITITYEITDGYHTLTIEDDGVGIPEVDLKNISSLGLHLVQSLVEQLDGKMNIKSDSGTKFTIKFKEMKYKARI